MFLRPPFAGLRQQPAAQPDDPHFFLDPSVTTQGVVAGARLVGQLRIDNAGELARRLGFDAAGAADDPHLFLHAFRRWGLDCFAQIVGDFAVAIWDDAERRLVLARDAIGQWPLHYRKLDAGLVFASLPIELAALAGHPRADMVQLVARLAFMPYLGNRSFLEGVDRVRPGHAVIVDASGYVVERQWWQPDLSPLRISHDDAVEAVDAQLRSTVAAMIRTDAPIVASDLSAGLDSSLVVATAAGVTDAPQRLLALTAVASGPIDRPQRLFADESVMAAETAALNGVRHHIVATAAESPIAALDRWLPSMQEPIANPCNLGWIDSCYATASEAGAKVYLTGGRGNFTVTRPGMARLSDLARTGRFIGLARELRSYRAFAGGGWLGLLALSFAPMIPDSVWNAVMPSVYRRQTSFDSAMSMLLRDSAPVRAAVDELTRKGIKDIGALYADERPSARWIVARSVDDGTGVLSVRRRHGLELREPLSSRPLVELCLRLPTESYFREGRPRALARDLLRGHAPQSVIEETRRGWQGANWRAGFEPVRGEMAEELDRVREDPDLAEVIDVDRARAMLAAWPCDGWDDRAQMGAYRSTLFATIGAARFARYVREWTPA